MLRDRDWSVDDTRAGKQTEDLIGIDPDGKEWSIEVKKTRNIEQRHVDQARYQAAKRKLPWMLASHIHGTRSWLVRRQGEDEVIWRE